MLYVLSFNILYWILTFVYKSNQIWKKKVFSKKLVLIQNSATFGVQFGITFTKMEMSIDF